MSNQTDFLTEKEKKLLKILLDTGYFQNSISLSGLALNYDISTEDIKELSAKIFTQYLKKLVEPLREPLNANQPIKEVK